jgi:uncharacterized membrane protein YeiB
MNKRIIGLDVARALAVIGMIVVNFKVVFGDAGEGWVKSIAGIFEGKAAATFVVLAGVGIALMANKSVQNTDIVKLRTIQKTILKRSLFLFAIGISYIVIWPADILHYYGVYMAITVLLIGSKERTLLITAFALILIFPLLLGFWNYETAWDFKTLDYDGFWTISGFTRNLFFNGFHPVIPWTSFMLFGYWFGKQDLRSAAFVKKTFWISSIIFILIQSLSLFFIQYLSEGNPSVAAELKDVLGTSPMPPLPLYMFSGTAIAFSVISACILLANKFENTFVIDALVKTGQLALTFYVAHVIIGMGIIEALDPAKMGAYSIEFSLSYAFIFSLFCIIFALLWRKNNPSGPLEWLMRKVTG